MRNTRSWLVSLGLMIALSSLGFAQETTTPSAPSADETNKKLNDPTQPIKSLLFFDNIILNYYGRSGSGNQIMFQPVVPFTLANHTNILRFTLPYGTGGVEGKGLAPMQVFNLTMFKAGKGQFAVGPLINFMPNWQDLPPGDRIQAGPAWGYIRPVGRWTFGLLQQNLFSRHVKFSAIQPVIAYAFPKGWSVSTGQQQWAFDWENGGGVRGVPLGLNVGKLVTFPGKQMMKFAVNPEYNAKTIPGAPHWTVRFSANLLVR